MKARKPDQILEPEQKVRLLIGKQEYAVPTIRYLLWVLIKNRISLLVRGHGLAQ